MRWDSRSPCDPSSPHDTAPSTAPSTAPRPALAPGPEHRRDELAVLLRASAAPLAVLLARTARTFVGASAWTLHGYASAADFAREVLGRSGRWLRDLAALGDGLARLPALEGAILGSDGGAGIGRVAALRIARVASPESLAAWIEQARASTVRELQDAIRASRHAGTVWPMPSQAPVAPDAAADGMPLGTRPEATASAEDDDADGVEVRLRVPRSIRAVFADVRDLHHAVSGHHASVAQFVEALVGEASAGIVPPDWSLAPRRQGDRGRLREAALARAHGCWRHLPRPPELGDADVFHGRNQEDLAASRLAARVLQRVMEIQAEDSACAAHGHRSGSITPEELASRLRTLVHLEDAVERALGSLMAVMGASGDWRRLGFASAAHYAEERLGMGRRTAACRTGIVGALRHLPRLRAAYEAGTVGLEAAWLVRRALGDRPVQADAEAAWVEHAGRASVKRLRDEIRRLDLLEAECAPVAPAPAAAAAPQGVRRVPPLPATDAEWRAFLVREPGMSRARVARWGAMAVKAPDADVVLCLRLPEDLAAGFAAAIETRRRHVTAQAVLPAVELSPPAAAARSFLERGRTVPAWVGLLALLEDYARTWDDPAAFPRRPWNPTYDRDSWRCMAPGCMHWIVEDHHIVHRSQQGGDELSNQIALCSFHHRQGAHGDLARALGRAPLDVVWRLGKRELATWWRNEMRLDADAVAGRAPVRDAKQA